MRPCASTSHQRVGASCLQAVYCVEHPGRVLGLCMVAVVVCSLGLVRFSIETDPQTLWVRPGSQAAEEKADYDVSLPALRIEAVLRVATAQGHLCPLQPTALPAWYCVRPKAGHGELSLCRLSIAASHACLMTDICAACLSSTLHLPLLCTGFLWRILPSGAAHAEHYPQQPLTPPDRRWTAHHH